jgi:phosphatidylserine/phosphatidylglycerophosphate/cardiolipin synthase-like enzyme
LLPLDTSPVRLGANPELVDAQILPSGPSFDNDNNLKLFAAMIQNARRRISVTSPYYVPDETIQMALVTAGSRGLDVELFVSGSRAVEDDYRAKSRQVVLSDWLKRSRREKVFDNLMRLTSSLQ